MKGINMMKKNATNRLFCLLVLLCALPCLNCVSQNEYVRMRRTLGMEIIDLRQRKDKNKKKLVELKNEVKDLKKSIAKNAKTYAALQTKCSANENKLKAQIKALTRERKRHLTEISKCGNMLKGSGKKLFDLQSELGKKEEELKKKQEEFEKNQKMLTAKLKQQQDALKAQQDKLKATIAKAERLESQVRQLQQIYTDLQKKLEGLVKAGKLRIEMVKGLLVLQLPEKILFASGSASVKREGKSAISNVTQILKDMKYRWQVVGHTDSRGAARSNWRLSSRRALSVLFVMLKAGMPATQISVAGFGQYQPKASNDTAADRATNRRTELILVPDLSEIFKSVGVQAKP